MRQFSLAFALLLLTGVTFGQELKKGNLVGMHIMDVKLEPGVTMERFTGFYVSKIIPELEKIMPGWKVYPVKRIRGEKAEGFAVMMVIRSERDRDKYFNPDGSYTDPGKAAVEKLQPLLQEWAKLGTTTDKYTDWLVY